MNEANMIHPYSDPSPLSLKRPMVQIDFTEHEG
jgi:hypothetical protein